MDFVQALNLDFEGLCRHFKFKMRAGIEPVAVCFFGNFFVGFVLFQCFLLDKNKDDFLVDDFHMVNITAQSHFREIVETRRRSSGRLIGRELQTYESNKNDEINPVVTSS